VGGGSETPELPDVTVYVEWLDALVRGARLQQIAVLSPFVLRSVESTVGEFSGCAIRRSAKRIVLEFSDSYFAVIHLTIAGRLRWRAAGVKVPKPNLLATFNFDTGTVLFNEAWKKKRALLHLLRGERALREHQRGGLEVVDAPPVAAREALCSENHTHKRALTDPRILSGIGNEY
jgi:formamidopyrimidine-DNA glycosylase